MEKLNTIKPEVGKSYRTRAGNRATVSAIDDARYATYIYSGTIELADNKTIAGSWDRLGAEFNRRIDGNNDLVEEISDPKYLQQLGRGERAKDRKEYCYYHKCPIINGQCESETKRTYTVLGVYDNGQVFSDLTKASSAFEAMQQVSKNLVEVTELSIIGTIEGEHRITTPCEDNGMAAYACDLT